MLSCYYKCCLTVALLLLVIARCCNAAPRLQASNAGHSHNRTKRNGQPANYWWIPGVPGSDASDNINHITCGDPGAPRHGSSLFESVQAGAIVVHSCDPGHRLVGAKLRLCQSNGQWTPRLPQCVFVDCGDPGEPANGSKWVGSTFLGSFVKYICDPGFNLVGDSYRVCQSNGQWSKSLPRCEVLGCPRLLPPKSGQVSINGQSIGAVATFTCDSGFELVGAQTLVCGQAGNWQGGKTPVCRPVDCGPLASPVNGVVSIESTTLGSVAFYDCNQGFRLVGTETRNCQGSGVWSGSEPSCQALQCSRLPDIENGLVALTSLSVGSVARYSCNSGFDLVGESSRTCQQDGEWSGEEPDCKLVSCGQLPDPENGQATLTGITVGAVATYTCNQGFHLVGNERRVCQSSGEWSLQAPRCQVVDCGVLDSPENGLISFTSTTFASVATYTCFEDFELIGVTQRVCQLDGSWSGQEPICRISGCDDLLNPTNGLVFLTGASIGSLATYICNNGFLLDGNRNRVCQTSGVWSGEEPRCLSSNCEQLASPANGQVTVTGTSVGSVATYSCNVGFTLVGTSFRVCRNNGVWSDAEPSCLAIDCGRLIAPTNGVISFISTIFNSVATYTCNSGFTLVGVETRTCQANGQWSAEEPVCQISQCDVLSDPANGEVSLTGLTISSQAIYLCDAGFIIQGSRIRVCQLDGEWSGIEPTCAPVFCPVLSDPFNGQVVISSRRIGGQAAYTCDQGFVLVGSDHRTCQPSGVWSGVEPLCAPLTCDRLDNPSNGHVILTGVTVNSVATYICSSGFVLVGEDTRTCQPNGEWSGQEPVCSPSGCNPLPSPPNGRVTLTGTAVGSRASYTCNLGFTLSETQTRVCQADGSWTGEEPTCTIVDCSSLPNPQQGSVVFTTTTFNSTATYSCDQGFRLVGGSERICQANGLWSGVEPFCTSIVCGRLNNPENGRVELSGTTVGSVATYICSLGFQLIGQNSRECLSSGEWTGQAPTCVAILCPELPNPTNGEVSLTGNTVGSLASYSCDLGFGLVGFSTRICQPTGQWSGQAPTCQPAMCPELQPPANGLIVTTGTQFGSTATYSCLPGFNLVGNEQRTCQANGFWSGIEPFCQAVQCEFLLLPVNGRVDQSGTAFGSAATYSCLLGFKLVGETERICQENGEWSGQAPFCMPISCAELQDPANGQVTLSGTTFRSLAIYTCNPGFSLVGIATRTCEASGQWSRQPPTCSAQRCPSLDPPQNGQVVVSGLTSGSTATYSCLGGFSLVGNEVRTCLENGIWSSVPPFCRQVTCEVLQSPLNGRVIQTGTQVGDMATYACLPGFVLRGPEIRTCEANGVWSLQEPTCVAVNCGELTAPRNGQVVLTGTSFSSQAIYSCNEGFGLVGVSIRTCQANGTWSGQAPICQLSQCESLDPPANGNVQTTGTDFWDTATYSCNEGFVRIGVSSRTCQANGVWSATPPFCSAVECPILEPPKDGNVLFTSVRFGTVATYTCHPGFTLIGNEERTCLESGLWSGNEPSCRRIDCGFLVPPKNGDINFSQGTGFGSVATYACDSPFQLMGEATRVCQESGVWSREAPSCEALQCPELGAPANGNVVFNGSIPGSSAVYSCREGFALIGSEIRTCQDNGFWTGVTPLCQPSDCGPLKSPDNGDVELTGITIGSRAFYSCNEGFNLVGGDEVRTCLDSGEWSGQEPSCSAITCGSLPSPLNGAVEVTGMTFGDTATYSCNTGFVLFGKGIRECRQDGTWNGKTPDCRVIDCGRLDDPRNGFVSFEDTTFGSVATYTCDAAFVLVGFQTRVCQITSTWSGDEPLCRPVNCPNLVSPANGRVEQGGNTFGDTAAYICDEGFRVSGTIIRTCLADGQWSGTASTCEPVNCGDLPAPDNGRVIFLDGTVFGSVVTYECNAGFNLVGIAIRSCEADGNWSGIDPTCEIVVCGSLPHPSGGTVSLTGTTFGSEATYSCRSGFTLVGEEIRVCTAEGSWSGVALLCNREEEFDCGRLDSPANGLVQLSGTNPGSLATYSCNNGFRLQGGNQNRRCVDNVGWLGTVPTCEPVDCGILLPPVNGRVLTTGSTFGSMAFYNCDEGFLLLGSMIRTCQAIGVWTTEGPLCSPVECGRLQNPVNGVVTETDITLASIATYSCNEGFTLEGQPIRTCQSDGDWSGSAPLCNRVGPVGCGDPGTPENGRRDGTDFRIGATVYYVCDESFELVGPGSRICQTNGLWSGFLPTCTPSSAQQCTNSGETVVDACGRRCTCSNGRLIECCRERQDFASMSASEKRRYITAVIRATSDPQFSVRYEAIIAKYKSSFDTLAQDPEPTISQFFPWNRFFLLEYENLLREIDCRITLPFWDWTALPLNPYMSPVFSPDSGFGDSSRGNDSCVSNGPFNFRVFEITESAGGGCLQRQYRMQMFPTRAIVDRDLLTLPASEFNQFHQFLQVFIHTNVRCFVGGQMCSTDAANDPVFILHLTQIDSLFSRWQTLNPAILNTAFVNDNQQLVLSNGLTVSQFASNANLGDGGVRVCYAEPNLKNHVPSSMRFLTDVLESMTDNRALHLECVGDQVMKEAGGMSEGAEDFMHKMCEPDRPE